MQPDYFAVPIEVPPAGLVSVGQVWRAGDERQYLSVLVGGREKWFFMAATNGRERSRCN